MRYHHIFGTGFAGVFFLLAVGSAHSALNPRETPIVKVVRENAQSVVNISTERVLYLRENPYWGSYGNELDYFFGRFFGMQPRTRALRLQSVGSGVIVEESGIIVTNAHVVHMASNIVIIFNNGSTVEGEVVYENPAEDLALVKIDPPEGIEAVEMGTTDDIMIGETAIAIGNPLGLENSVTAGIISGVDREVFSSQGEMLFDGLLQVDTPINPGNSGGALMNLNGELIGINVAVVQNSQSIGFSIPVEKVKQALASHRKNRGFSLRANRKFPRRKQQQQQQPSGRAPQRRFSRGDSWDPFSEMRRMQEEMDRLFDGFFRDETEDSSFGVFNSNISFDTSLDVEEKEDRYVMKMDIKGLDQNKINIDIKPHSLTISGQRSSEQRQETPGGMVQSQGFSSFIKTVPLPGDVDTEGVQSRVEGEMLIIDLPKRI